MTKDLVFIQNDQALTTSLTVAEYFEKRHDHILRDVRGLISEMGGVPKIGESSMFEETTYINSQNKTQPMYLMNRDGFMLLVMGLTGKKALKKKLQFIKAFNKMEETLKRLLEAGKDAKWLATREQGKLTRKSEVSAIRIFIEYARSQGCNWEDKYFYSNLSVLCNEGAGLPRKKRSGQCDDTTAEHGRLA